MVLEYEKIEESERFTSGMLVELEKTIVYNGEELNKVYIARGSGMGASTVGIFDKDEKLLLEGVSEETALANLVIRSDNHELSVEESD